MRLKAHKHTEETITLPVDVELLTNRERPTRIELTNRTNAFIIWNESCFFRILCKKPNSNNSEKRKKNQFNEKRQRDFPSVHRYEVPKHQAPHQQFKSNAFSNINRRTHKQQKQQKQQEQRLQKHTNMYINNPICSFCHLFHSQKNATHKLYNFFGAHRTPLVVRCLPFCFSVFSFG